MLKSGYSPAVFHFTEAVGLIYRVARPARGWKTSKEASDGRLSGAVDPPSVPSSRESSLSIKQANDNGLKFGMSSADGF
ncbi:hypothetical protein SK128_018681, partial [Halocaridina rubra]